MSSLTEIELTSPIVKFQRKLFNHFIYGIRTFLDQCVSKEVGLCGNTFCFLWCGKSDEDLSLKHDVLPKRSCQNPDGNQRRLVEQRLTTSLWKYLYPSIINILGKKLKSHSKHTKLFLLIVHTKLPPQAQKTFPSHSVVPKHSLFGMSNHHCMLSYSSPTKNDKTMLY